MRLTFIAVMTCALFLFPTLGYAADEAPSCDVIELAGQPNYDALVCSGIAAMERKDFTQAISLFEQAMDVSLFEWPNFVLFPRLALAYHYAGQTLKAQETLEKADFSLKILTRIFDCIELPDEDRIVRREDPDQYQVESPYYDEIANRMCGAVYPRAQSLDQTLWESILVREFLAIKALIEAGVSGDGQAPILIRPQ